MELPYLRDLRRRAVLSQEQLAEKSGVARETISKLESGRRGAYPSTIRKLAAGLEVEPGALMGGVVYFEYGPEEGSPESAAEESERGGGRIGF